VSRSGSHLVFLAAAGRGIIGAALWGMPLAGRSREPILFDDQAGREEGQGQISPDGRWLAYVADVTGSPQVIVRPFSGGAGRWMVSTAGGYEPKWRADGRELYYLAPDQMMMAVPVEPGPQFSAGEPQPLFRTQLVGAYLGSPFPNGRVRNEYAVSPDGQRFLINQPSEGTSAYAVRVLVNWPALIAN
jgi:hypothetical protein